MMYRTVCRVRRIATRVAEQETATTTAENALGNV